jgi:hypothetical protein
VGIWESWNRLTAKCVLSVAGGEEELAEDDVPRSASMPSREESRNCHS